jgi:gliding motility-associated-like protein
MGNSLYYDNIIWSFGDTSSPVSDESNPIHTFEVIGETRVCVTAMNSKCSDTSCKEIFIRFIPLVGVPNAFSPNGDGVNDVVKVEGKGIVEMTFIIYNRWGQKVFESHDINQGWDGTFNGVMQEVDAYAYTLQATLINKQIVSKKGNITLLR